MEPAQQQVVIGTAVAGGLILAYLLSKKRKVRTIPVGEEGWWGAGEKPQIEDHKIYSFEVQTSDEEIKVYINLLLFCLIYYERMIHHIHMYIFCRTFMNVLTEPATQILWKMAAFSMASIPPTSSK